MKRNRLAPQEYFTPKHISRVVRVLVYADLQIKLYVSCLCYEHLSLSMIFTVLKVFLQESQIDNNKRKKNKNGTKLQ